MSIDLNRKYKICF